MNVVIKRIKEVWMFITLVLLAYAFEWSKNIVKGIIISFSNEYYLGIIANVFYKVKPILNLMWFLFLLILMIIVGVKFIYTKYKKKLYKQMMAKRDDLDMALYNYINSIDPSCFLLYGSWGIGKSCRITEFIKEIKDIKYRNIYRISCFGISSREALLKEIQSVCEEEDKSVLKKIIDILHNVPVIGELAYSLLKKEYQLSSIKEGSIFVFDDFERIAPSNLAESEKYHYSRNPYLGREMEHIIGKRGEREIIDELKEIERAITRLENRDYCQAELYEINKFNLVTSLINEMQEHYKMRIVIIANKAKIPDEIFKDVIESKLACRKFKLKTPEKIFDKLAKKQLDSFIYIKKEEKEFIKNILEDNSLDINNVWELSEIDNARVLNNIICAFISCIEKYNLFSDKKLAEDLLYSILLAHISIDGNFSKTVMDIELGENPLLFFEKHKYTKNPMDNINNVLRQYSKFHQLRWCGNQLSFEWALGNHQRADIACIINSIKKYDSTFAEQYLCNEVDFVSLNFDDAMLAIAKGDTKNIEKVKSMLKTGSIDTNSVNNKYIDIDKDRGYNNIQRIILCMDFYHIDLIYSEDYELKILIFNLIKTMPDDLNEKQRLNYSVNYINYKNYIEFSG